MENTDTPVQTEKPTTVVEPVPKETTTPTTTESVSTTEETTTSVPESVEKKEDEVVPTTTAEDTEETSKSTDEQENVTDANPTVPPNCLSPGRANVPLKEVNESGKEEAAVIPNGTENGLSKKRELEQEDEPTEETSNDNDERTTVDQSKKLKVTEVTDTPIIETKEAENNIIVNGNTAVEV